ncbi:histone-lysine N-methyltransferase SUV39H2 isoform 2 [Aphelenchoides avenae]|nr:histone-lysine N-methyltransferase SUV39H2 isoform 2 [Aphelenchus avenae]
MFQSGVVSKPHIQSHLNGSTALHTDIAGPSSIKKTSNTNTKVTKHVAKQHSVGVELDAAEDQCHAALEITECGDANGEKADADEHLEDTQEDDLVWPADEECFLCEIFVTRELQDFQAIIDDCEEAMWANAEDDDTADVSGMAGEEASWEVEKILFIDRKESNTALVKWRDWNYKPDYWEALENLTGCEDLFDDYKRRLKLNTAIAATLKFNDRLFWPDLWESPAFLRCHEWEDEIGRKSVEAGYAPLYVENWVDKEPRPKKFEFIVKNIISDETRATFVKPPPSECTPCECGEECGAGSKCCPKYHGYKLFYTAANRLYNRYDRKKDFLFECTPECNCDVRTCPTRVVQRGRQIPVIIFRTANRGWGLRTAVKIPPRTFVMEYVGELLPIEKTEERSGAYSFDVNGHGSGATKFFIDSQYCGNEARFVNHSCEPNLEAVNVYCEREDSRYWRIAFFTRDKEVLAGDELTLSYVGNDEKEFGKRAASRKKPNCQCGAKTCRKYF